MRFLLAHATAPRMRRVIACALAVGCAPAGADEQAAPLPDPLTLEYALSLAGEAHPDLQQARALLEQARAERRQAEARTGVRAGIEASALWVDPAPLSPDTSHNDSNAKLVVRKRLYDFGRSRNRFAAADADIKGREWLYIDVRRGRRIDIMRRYFEVLLADLRYSRDNEAMAVVYVERDHLRKKRAQGEVSDVTVLRAESEYQAIRRARYASDAARRITRARLAEALNRPGDLPGHLAEPRLPQDGRTLSALDKLTDQALRDNPVLRALRERLAAARKRVQAARAGGNPVLSGLLEGAKYHRLFGARDRWRAGVTLELPLFTGGAVQAEVARALADVHVLEARFARRRMDVRQAVLDVWERIQVLQVQRQEARALADYRDLYLDRSRALYQLELRTDLGDSMVRLSEARLRRAETRYQLALSWARLDALTGRPVFPLSKPAPRQTR